MNNESLVKLTLQIEGRVSTGGQLKELTLIKGIPLQLLEMLIFPPKGDSQYFHQYFPEI